MTVTIPGWTYGKVAPTTLEVPVVD